MTRVQIASTNTVRGLQVWQRVTREERVVRLARRCWTATKARLSRAVVRRIADEVIMTMMTMTTKIIKQGAILATATTKVPMEAAAARASTAAKKAIGRPIALERERLPTAEALRGEVEVVEVAAATATITLLRAEAPSGGSRLARGEECLVEDGAEEVGIRLGLLAVRRGGGRDGAGVGRERGCWSRMHREGGGLR